MMHKTASLCTFCAHEMPFCAFLDPYIWLQARKLLLLQFRNFTIKLRYFYEFENCCTCQAST